MDIKEILNKIEEVKPSNLNLYFITRILKEGIKSSDKVLDKYFFKVYQIEITDDIRNYLYELSKKQFEKIYNNNELIFHDYDIFSDDSEHLFTYQMKNKVISFSDVVYNQLVDSPPKITNLNELLKNENLWAYCVGFQINYQESFYTFRKINPGKVGVDKENDGSKKKILENIRTIFDTNTNTLSLLKGETIYLDKQIDCIFYEESFYILKKGYFEQIIGLQEEYKEEATNFVKSLSEDSNFGDVELLNDKIRNTPSIHKKLVRLKKIGNTNGLNNYSVNRLISLGKERETPINVKNGKIIFETETDIENTIKLLCDYYKKGEFSEKVYGTYAGKEFKNKNNL